MSQVQVWWIPQIPMKAFEVPIDFGEDELNLKVAKFLTHVLAEYDIFQFENNIKPDYSNTGGVSVQEVPDGEWWDVEASELGEMWEALKEEIS